MVIVAVVALLVVGVVGGGVIVSNALKPTPEPPTQSLFVDNRTGQELVVVVQAFRGLPAEAFLVPARGCRDAEECWLDTHLPWDLVNGGPNALFDVLWSDCTPIVQGLETFFGGGHVAVRPDGSYEQSGGGGVLIEGAYPTDRCLSGAS